MGGEKVKSFKKRFLEKLKSISTPRNPAFVQAAVIAIIFLAIGMSVATVSTTIGTAIAAKAYATVQTDISGISDANIKTNATNAIVSSFSAQKTNADFQPLMLLGIVLAVITILLFGALTAGMGGGRVSSASF